MPRRSRGSARTLNRHTVELALAAPQVVALRVARMAAHGPRPSARDRRELHRMTAEKSAAFVESWQAIGLATLRAQQTLLLSMTQAALRAWTPAAVLAHLGRSHAATLDVLAHGLAPVHRRAVANAKRLCRRRGR